MVVGLSCGTGCASFSVVDIQTLQVAGGMVAAICMDHRKRQIERMEYRLDSRLLIVRAAVDVNDRASSCEESAFVVNSGRLRRLEKRARPDWRIDFMGESQ